MWKKLGLLVFLPIASGPAVKHTQFMSSFRTPEFEAEAKHTSPLDAEFKNARRVEVHCMCLIRYRDDFIRTPTQLFLQFKRSGRWRARNMSWDGINACGTVANKEQYSGKQNGVAHDGEEELVIKPNSHMLVHAEEPANINQIFLIKSKVKSFWLVFTEAFSFIRPI